MKNYLLLFTFIFLSIYGCVPPQNKNKGRGSLEFSDKIVQSILKYSVNQTEDSLVTYLDHENVGYQLLALNAFSSYTNTKYKSKIVEKLNSSDIEVSSTAAYVVGQIGDSSHVEVLIQSFRGQDSTNVDNIHNHNILEAIGKLGTLEHAEKIASVTTYRPTDSLLTLGQIRSLYRFCLRGIIPIISSETAVKYTENRAYKAPIRQMAAHLLSRSKDVDLTPYAERIIAVINNENNEGIKMALVSALGKSKTESVRNKLIDIALGNGDYRTKVNAIKSLGTFKEDEAVLDTLKPLITNSNLHLAESYADLLNNTSSQGMFVRLSQIIPSVNNGFIKAKLLQTQMKNTSLSMGNSKIIIQENALSLIKQSTNEYEKAELIKVLGHDPYQYLNLINLQVNTPVEKVAKMNSLQYILDSKDFIAAYKNNYIKVKREIINYFANQMKEGDPSVVTQVASLLQKENNQAKIILIDSLLIDATLTKLKTPDDLEAIQEVKKLDAFLKDIKYEEPKVVAYKPIDFTLFEGKGDSIEVTMKTDKGNVIIVLFPKIAPQTVSSFIDLCQKGYFNNKSFHRVVPNFVVQGGCPKGDGSGSLNFTLRTEVPQTYYDGPGCIGMASSGFHTESCQFFFTHSATPHLDGKYTLFGKVIKGMDIVNDIRIGDRIIDTFVKK
jgi:cyclophilin family peptidyl-prolyl cis-trans isomerase/HEAT repeat protein